jgi:small subunit ribosomal protein S1
MSKVPVVGDTVRGRIIKFYSHGALLELTTGLVGILLNKDYSWLERKSLVSDHHSSGDEFDVMVLTIERSKKTDKLYMTLGYKQLQPNPWLNLHSTIILGTTLNAKIESIGKKAISVRLSNNYPAILPKTELSWSNPHKKKDVMIGQELQVIITSIDTENHSIEVSHKRTIANPWEQDLMNLVGTQVTGTVIALLPFGAILGLRNGLPALLHCSELTWSEKTVPIENYVKKGDTIDVIITSIDLEKRRVAVSLRQIHGDPWCTIITHFPIGTVTYGEVKATKEYGVFVILENGCVGLLHKTKCGYDINTLQIGDDIRVVIYEIDITNKRIALCTEEDLGKKKICSQEVTA